MPCVCKRLKMSRAREPVTRAMRGNQTQRTPNLAANFVVAVVQKEANGLWSALGTRHLGHTGVPKAVVGRRALGPPPPSMNLQSRGTRQQKGGRRRRAQTKTKIGRVDGVGRSLRTPKRKGIWNSTLLPHAHSAPLLLLRPPPPTAPPCPRPLPSPPSHLLEGRGGLELAADLLLPARRRPPRQVRLGQRQALRAPEIKK